MRTWRARHAAFLDSANEPLRFSFAFRRVDTEWQLRKLAPRKRRHQN